MNKTVYCSDPIKWDCSMYREECRLVLCTRFKGERVALREVQISKRGQVGCLMAWSEAFPMLRVKFIFRACQSIDCNWFLSVCTRAVCINSSNSYGFYSTSFVFEWFRHSWEVFSAWCRGFGRGYGIWCCGRWKVLCFENFFHWKVRPLLLQIMAVFPFA